LKVADIGFFQQKEKARISRLYRSIPLRLIRAYISFGTF